MRRYGLKEKWTNVIKKRVHDAAVKLQQRVAVSIHENVVGYEEDWVSFPAPFLSDPYTISHQDFLDAYLKKHARETVQSASQSFLATLHSICSDDDGHTTRCFGELILKNLFAMFCVFLRLDGRMFGHPHSRERVWRICYDKRLKKWNCKYSLEELAKIMLAPVDQLKLDYSAYLLALPQLVDEAEVYETDLSEWLDLNTIIFQQLIIQNPSPTGCQVFHPTSAFRALRSQAKRLRAFRNLAPEKSVYDVSQDPEYRKRTENKDKSLPCLTTSSQLWLLNSIHSTNPHSPLPTKLHK